MEVIAAVPGDAYGADDLGATAFDGGL